MLRLDLSKEKVMNVDVEALVNQCKNIQYLNLSETWVTYSLLPDIVLAWKTTLVDLSLPQSFRLDLGMDEHEPKQVVLNELVKNLKSLHVGDLFQMFISQSYDFSRVFLCLKSEKNLDLRKILVTPKIFLKSRVHCTNIYWYVQPLRSFFLKKDRQKDRGTHRHWSSNSSLDWLMTIPYLPNLIFMH